MTSSALVTVTVPGPAEVVPPLAMTLTRAWYFNAPLMPLASPPMPRMTSVSPPSVSTAACIGVLMPAVKEIRPGLSAFSRMTITCSGALAKTSRV